MVTTLSSTQENIQQDSLLGFIYQMTTDLVNNFGLEEKQAAEMLDYVTHRLQEEYGGEKVQIHQTYMTARATAAHAARNKQVIDLYNNGWCGSKIAAHIGMSVGTSYRIIHAHLQAMEMENPHD